MLVSYHPPLGNPDNKQDCLPDDWADLANKSGPMPDNFGTVHEGKLYRSAIIWAHQIELLYNRFKITHIINLIDGDHLEQFYNDPQITIHRFPFLQRKELTFERVKDIVLLINSLKEPAIVFCLKGKTRTGMVCAGYDILNGRKTNLEAMTETMKYGNLNISSFREILHYSRDKG